MTLSSRPSALIINRWAVRETIVGITAVNAPIMKPSKHLFRASTTVLTDPVFNKSFWNRDYKTRAEERNRRQQGFNNSGGSSGKMSRLSELNTMLRKPEPIEIIEYSGSINSKTMKTDTTWGSKSHNTTAKTTLIDGEAVQRDNGSQERLMQRPLPAAQGDGSRDLDIEKAEPLHPHPGSLVKDLYGARIVQQELPEPPERALEWNAGRLYRPSLV